MTSGWQPPSQGTSQISLRDLIEHREALQDLSFDIAPLATNYRLSRCSRRRCSFLGPHFEVVESSSRWIEGPSWPLTLHAETRHGPNASTIMLVSNPVLASIREHIQDHRRRFWLPYWERVALMD